MSWERATPASEGTESTDRVWAGDQACKWNSQQDKALR